MRIDIHNYVLGKLENREYYNSLDKIHSCFWFQAFKNILELLRKFVSIIWSVFFMQYIFLWFSITPQQNQQSH